MSYEQYEREAEEARIYKNGFCVGCKDNEEGDKCNYEEEFVCKGNINPKLKINIPPCPKYLTDKCRCYYWNHILEKIT